MPTIRTAAILLLGLLAAALPAPTPAQTAPGAAIPAWVAPAEAPAGTPLTGRALDERTDAVTSKLRCPVCQGLSVADSHTPTAVAMKEQARDLLRQGYSERQVLAHFEKSYGEFVRLEPKAEGFNLLVWVAPILVLAGGIALVARRVTRRAPGRPAAAATTTTDDLDEPWSPSRDLPGRGEAHPPAGSDPGLDPYLEKLREEIRRS